MISVGPLSKVQFGWLMHVPPIAICDKLQIATRKALNEPKRSCIFLRDILRGHNLHVGFRMLQNCVSAVTVFRFFQRCTLPAWTKLVSQVPYQPNSPVLGGLELALGHGGTLMLVKPFPLTLTIPPSCLTLTCYPIACARASVPILLHQVAEHESQRRRYVQ